MNTYTVAEWLLQWANLCTWAFGSLCYCFHLISALLIFTNISNIAIALLRVINVRIIVFSGLLVSNFSNSQRNNTRMGKTDFSIAELRFFHKCEKISARTWIGNRFVWSDNKFKNKNPCLAPAKGFGYPKQVHITSNFQGNYN